MAGDFSAAPTTEVPAIVRILHSETPDKVKGHILVEFLIACPPEEAILQPLVVIPALAEIQATVRLKSGKNI